MPIYDFKCKECGETFEKLVPLDTVLVLCDKCFSYAEKILATTAPAVKFNGTGFYQTYYKNVQPTTPKKGNYNHENRN